MTSSVWTLETSRKLDTK